MFRPSTRFFALAALASALQACTLTVPGVGTLAKATEHGVLTGATAGPALEPAAPSKLPAKPPVTTQPNGQLPTETSASANSQGPATGVASADSGAAVFQGNPGQPASFPAPPTAFPAQPVSQESLRAGAIDDNAKFDDFLSYLRAYAGEPLRPYDVSERHVITVRDASGQPAANVKVTVSAGEQLVFTGTTYANGQLLFLPKANPASDVGSRFFVTAGDDTTHAIGFSRTSATPWDLTVSAAVATPMLATPMYQRVASATPRLDLQIVLDTTGSMGGEIAQLQSTLSSIARRISALPQAPSVRFSLVAFKDQQGSEYLTRKQDFTAELPTFASFLNGLTASGGGDLPEDDETALAEALQQHWDPTASARLSFLITDAPTHTNYAQSTPYTASIARAQAMGVKFYTVGASGLPASGELFLRTLAQATMGKYMFITRGGDEYRGGGEVSATVDHFSEGRLDELMVDAVKAELAGLTGPQLPPTAIQ